MQKFLQNVQETEHFGADLHNIIPAKSLIFLKGDLGAGKTTLVRGYLRAAGYQGNVKSPTYNIVEEYVLSGNKVYHFDLYRINSPEELEWLGIRDYFEQPCVCFIEWPDRGEDLLPGPDYVIDLTVQGEGRLLEMYSNSKK